MREEKTQVRDGHVLRIATSHLNVVSAQGVRERMPGAGGEVIIAGRTDLIDPVLQAVEGGSFESHIEPF